MADVPLLILESPYRSLTQPLLEYVKTLRQVNPDAYIHIILGDLTTESFWEQALHRNSTVAFHLALRQIDGVVLTDVPFQLHHLQQPRQPH